MNSSKEMLNSILLSDDNIELYGNELLEILPELIVCQKCEQNMPAHRMPVLAHIYEVVNGVDKDVTLKLAALFHDIGKPYVKKTVKEVDSFKGHEQVSEVLAGFILQRLGFEKEIKQDVSLLIRYHDFELSPTKESIDNITEKIGRGLVLPLLKLQRSDLLAHSEQKVREMLPARQGTIGYYLNNYVQQTDKPI